MGRFHQMMINIGFPLFNIDAIIGSKRLAHTPGLAFWNGIGGIAWKDWAFMSVVPRRAKKAGV